MPSPAAGDVWSYPYLWRRQHEGGETEGRKTRPIAFVAAVKDRGGKTHLFILPITSAPPAPNRLAIEVPPIERKRAGLDAIPLWVMLDEYNYDILEQSYYLEPSRQIGAFSSAFHQKVLRAFARAAREKSTRRVPRAD